MKLNRLLKELRDKSEIEEEVYNQIRSTGLHDLAYMGYRKPIRKTVLSDPSFP